MGRWVKGQCGNGGRGRPKGSKNRFPMAFKEDLTDVWNREKCKDRLIKLIREDDAFFMKFLEILARIQPKELDIDLQARPITVMPTIKELDGSEKVFDLAGDPVPEIAAQRQLEAKEIDPAKEAEKNEKI